MSTYFGTSLFSIGSSLTRKILDTVFKDCCLILTDLNETGIFTLNQAPLIGFSFQDPSQVEFFNYSYSEYPYLNRTAVANSVMKNSSTIVIKGLRPITRTNNMLVNYAYNSAVLTVLDNYIMKGGRFKLFTKWGPISNLVMESINGVDEDGQGGIALEFTLRRIFVAESSTSSTASALLRIITG